MTKLMAYNDWSLSPKKLTNAFPNLPSSTTRFLPPAIGVLGFLGFLDAVYLTIQHYKNAIPPCTLSGCEVVLTSKYATIIPGIPTSLIGAFYYLAVIALVGIYLSVGKPASGSAKSITGTFVRSIPTILVLLTGLGLLIGLGLVYIQAFVLHAFCQYCLASEVIDFLLFDCAWWLWRKSE